MSNSTAIVALVVVGVLAYVAGLTTASLERPRNYNDCVLDAMKGGNRGMEATMLIHRVCQQKFPL